MLLIQVNGLLLSRLLVKDILVLTHAFSLHNAKLLALLIPAPLVNLSFGEVRLCRDVQECLLGPVRVRVEGESELLQLHGCLALTLANDTFHLTAHLIKHVSSAFSMWYTTSRIYCDTGSGLGDIYLIGLVLILTLLNIVVAIRGRH